MLFDYTWLNSYINSDIFWLESNINWNNISSFIWNESSYFSILLYNFFNSSFIYIDAYTKISLMDLLFFYVHESLINSRELFDIFLLDYISKFQIKSLTVHLTFYSDFQDFVVLLFFYSPEMIIIFDEIVNSYYFNQTLNYSPNIVFDFFHDHLNHSFLHFFNYLIYFFSFIWTLIFFIGIFRIIKWNKSSKLFFFKITKYIHSISKEVKFQFEILLQVFFFVFLYWTMLIATFDDDQEETIELFDTLFFYFFLFLISYMIYKHSIHFYAFLEASITEGRSLIFIFKQFFRDIINIFALLLRFFILLFRLNIYDTLDDFYDSYYIYFEDFEEENYHCELFLPYNFFMFYDYDSKDDVSYFFPNEKGITIDLYYIGYIYWTKFFYFIFFILEEILRISLAFYICYLIVFEIHSVNCSYNEENFLYKNKFSFINK